MKYESLAIPFITIGNKQFLGMKDIKNIGLEDFIERFRQCFDFEEAASEGRCGAYFYPNRLQEEEND